MPKKKPMDGKPAVNKQLEGFEIKINEFGEIKSNFQVERLNEFLDRTVDDKKLLDKPEFPVSEKPKTKGKEDKGKTPLAR